MFALTLFFIAVFAILDTTAQSLRAARSLQMDVPDIGELVPELMLTNRLEEGVVEGDFGDRYPGFSWVRDVYLHPEATNALYQIDFTILGAVGGHPYEATTSLLLWRPDSDRVVPGLRR
jgi:hypothetical protein